MKTFTCLNCDKENAWIRQNANKYCNNSCQAQYQSKQKVKAWLNEELTWKNQIPNWAKRHLADVRGYSCESCGITNWNGKEITLEVDHIDGQPYNNKITNLRLLCPNCHSQTPTYKAKNTGNGRNR